MELPDISVERPAADQAVAVFKGEHDLVRAAAVRELLSELVAEHELVVVDLSEALFFDSTMISVLLYAKREASERLHRFRVQVAREGAVRRVLDLAGVLPLLDPTLSLADALADVDAE